MCYSCIPAFARVASGIGCHTGLDPVSRSASVQSIVSFLDACFRRRDRCFSAFRNSSFVIHNCFSTPSVISTNGRNLAVSSFPKG